ncbi:RNA-directed DNA polymerase [Paraglaciecola agarilytica]|uniref:RNA-directed DNA polymerase n=1 Tax=Paraglaciecola chathamensis TaxID=368405 RepID=UPI001C081168|nr:RNA-directed DNA polymerase [Paraglaciecola agarilytica]MBU3017986.1 RNA-directed DNA polymerase [Paraglaciecola agarilytica]
MGLLDNKYRELKLTDDYLTDPVVLAQAWKKSQQYIRSTNWYADTFELDKSTLSLRSNLESWNKELIAKDYILTELRLVPAPKSTAWEFVDVPKFPHRDVDLLDWEFSVDALEGLNQSWQPVISDDKNTTDENEKKPLRVVPALRPLAHVPVKEQTYFTALMMCAANKVETLQGDSLTEFELVHSKKVVSYGNRLFCRYKDEEAKFSWGNSTVYSKYFTDYQRFLERPAHFGFLALQEKVRSETVYEIHLDLSRFFDRIKRDTLTRKMFELIDDYSEKQNPSINYLLDQFKKWEWEAESKELYKKVCLKGDEDIPLGIPQGLVAGGFLANVYMLDFDLDIATAIGTNILDNCRLVDYCRYVDDMRLIVVSTKSITELKAEIEKYVNDQIADLNLEVNDSKTRVEVFRTKSSGTSSKLKAIQGKVSGPISNREIDEQLGHLEGLINLSDYLRSSSENTEGNNPLYLVEAPNHDVREDTIVRFSANKIHKLLRQKRSFYAHELDGSGKAISGNWDYIQERMARKFIACWSKDPSLTLLLKKGLELFPDVKIVDSIVSQIRFIHNRDDDRQKYLAEYFLCEIFRHSATVIHSKEEWGFPVRSDIAGYFEFLQCLAVDILENESCYSLNTKQQARFFLLVRNDSPFSYESGEDKSFNVLTKFMKGYRVIANDMTVLEFVSSVMLAYQLAHDQNLVVRAVSSFLEKVSKKVSSFSRVANMKSTKGLSRLNMDELLINLAVESRELFEKIVTYSRSSGLSWQKQSTEIINKGGFYQNVVVGNLSRKNTAYPLLGVTKRPDNPLAHENAILALLAKCLDTVDYDFASPVDLSESTLACTDWDNIQTLSVDIDIQLKADPSPLFSAPSWINDEHRPLYHVGMFVRSCLVGSVDWTESNVKPNNKTKYVGVSSGFVKRQFGLMHSPEAMNGDTAAMSSWLSSLLFHLLQWPGLEPHAYEENWPNVRDLKSLKQLIEKRIESQKKLFCQLSGIPGYIEKVSLGWDNDKRDLDVIMVQSLLPQKADFKDHGLMLDTPAYLAKHSRHIASVAELILHKKYSHESVESKREGKIDLIIWPELAVNSRDIHILKTLSDKTGAIIFTGLNFTHLPNVNGPNNVAKWIIPNKKRSGRSFIERLQGKEHMMKDEAGHIKPWRPYQLFIELVHPAFEKEQGFRLTGSICYDSTDIKLNADLKGKSNAYLIPALNMDVSTFDSMVDSLFYHMFQHIVLVNSGEFGGSVAKAPYKERHEKLITHVHGAQQVSISSFKMNMFDFRDLGENYKSNKSVKTKPAGN